MRRHPLACVVSILGVFLLPRLALAQTTGAIAGTAKDTTGAVLPGVTVEASSPALIERARTAITDSQGQYKIVDLRPGVYAVTFTLAGFSPYKREGIDISAGFTAAANAELKVGTLAETVTVTGASPVVDVQNARTQQVLKGDVLDALPNAGKMPLSFVAVTLGAMPSSPGRSDVGGDKVDNGSGISIHGSRGDDGRMKWDGFTANHLGGGGGGTWRVYSFNPVAIQEVVVDTGGNTAEAETGGANFNIVPKEGGNSLKLYGIANYTDSRFSAKAIPDSLAARGIGPQSTLKSVYQYGFGLGGPILHDRLWFFSSNAWWGAKTLAANNYFDKSTNPYVYVPDLTRPAYADSFVVDNGARFTWQAARKHKLNEEAHLQNACNCWLSIGAGAAISPEAATDFVYGPQVLSQTTWSYTRTSRLLIQGGAGLLNQGFSPVAGVGLNHNKFTGVGTLAYPGPNVFSILEQTTGYRWGSASPGLFTWAENNNLDQVHAQLTTSYVTGSHAFKAGLQVIHGNVDQTAADKVKQVTYTFRNGLPISLTQWAGPFKWQTRLNGQGLFAQDQWTLGKLTLNLGARYDHFNGRALAIDLPAGEFRPALHTDELKNLPNFHDITPRFGAAYDLFGDGRTAVKVGWGKYLMGQGAQLANTGFSPSVAIVTNTTRTWTDGNGNFVPDCDLKALTANGECGQVSNLAFGQPFSNQTLADDVREGWGNREYNYQWNAQLQHELRPGIGLTIGYFHTQWGNMSVTRNTRVTPADFTSYCITAPTDTRLGDASGRQICGYYDVNPDKFGQVAFEVTQASNFGTQKEYFNGVDIGVNARAGSGTLLTGGMSVGRQIYDYCYVNGRPDLTPQSFIFGFAAAERYPRNDDYCKVAAPWWDGFGTQIKFQAVQPLPYDMAVSAVFKHLPGIVLTSNYPLTNAQLAPSLGRNLAAGVAATATHAILAISGGAQAAASTAGSVFDERLNQLDVRLTKNIRVGRGRIQGQLDLYNVLNARTPQSIVTTYGAAWMRPTSLLGGRLFKFGAQLDW